LARNLFSAVEDKVYLAAFSFLDSQSTSQVVIVRPLEPCEKQAIGLLNHCRPPGARQPLCPDNNYYVGYYLSSLFSSGLLPILHSVEKVFLLIIRPCPASQLRISLCVCVLFSHSTKDFIAELVNVFPRKWHRSNRTGEISEILNP
jgi:hypothetical protein